MKNWIELVTGSLEDKKRYRQYKERVRQLPTNYREAMEALDRYLMYYGGIAKSDIMLAMLDDLTVLFEQAAADQTPIRSIVGDDPVEFIETFLANYSEGHWVKKERDRLTRAIAQAAGEKSDQDGSVDQ